MYDKNYLDSIKSRKASTYEATSSFGGNNSFESTNRRKTYFPRRVLSQLYNRAIEDPITAVEILSVFAFLGFVMYAAFLFSLV